MLALLTASRQVWAVDVNLLLKCVQSIVRSLVSSVKPTMLHVV